MRVNIWASKTIPTATVVAKTGLGMLHWGLCGGAIVAFSASLFGLFGGVLYRMIQGEFGNLGPIMLHFALSGAIAGALLGAFSRLTNPEVAADFFRNSPLEMKKADEVFVTPRPLQNPLIARWLFLERTGSRGDQHLNQPSLN